jgi:putative transposase
MSFLFKQCVVFLRSIAAWLGKPLSDRVIEDKRLLKQINPFYVASGGTYGSPRIHRDDGEFCSVNRVAKIMLVNTLKAQIGCKCRYIYGGNFGKIADNILARQFSSKTPDHA